MKDQFKERTRSIYQTLGRRGDVLFSLEALRAALRTQFDRRPICPYCSGHLTLKTVSADHRLPVARGGANDLDNIQFICKPCNKAKGDFTHEEFSYLLKLLEQMEAKFRNVTIKRRVVSALRISNSFRQGAMRRAKEAKG